MIPTVPILQWGSGQFSNKVKEQYFIPSNQNFSKQTNNIQNFCSMVTLFTEKKITIDILFSNN